MRLLTFTLLLLLFGLPVLQAQIVINEISYNPPEAGNDTLEYIELYNAGPTMVNLEGWYFSKGIVDTLPDTDLHPGSYFVTALDASAMQGVFGLDVHEWKSGALSNSGESIVLVDDTGSFVDSVAFGENDPWPSEPDGSGPSLELKDSALDNNDGSNWQASGASTGVIINGNEVKGTPGAANSSGGSSGPAVTIEVAHLEFTPPYVVVAVGDSVRWVNAEAIPHNVNGQQSVYPGNAESFFSGAPAVGPWQFDYQFTVPGKNDYHCNVHVGSGMRGVVAVYDPNGFTTFPLNDLRLTDDNGQALFNGVPTTVTGVVHGINFLPTGYSFYIINDDNVGINVFSPEPGDYVVTEGDEVQVNGVIGQFNGLLEIVPSAIDLLSSGNPLVPATEFVELNEETESSHLALFPFETDSVVATGTTGYNVYAKDALGNDVLIRVDADMGFDLATIESANAVRGIGTQFDSSFPFTEGYQILALELLIGDNVPFLDKDAVAIVPNPVNEKFTVRSDYFMMHIEAYTMDGRLVISQPVNANYGEINTSHLPVGLYTIKVVAAEGIHTSILSVNR